eukprot:g2978.t1
MKAVSLHTILLFLCIVAVAAQDVAIGGASVLGLGVVGVFGMALFYQFAKTGIMLFAAVQEFFPKAKAKGDDDIGVAQKVSKAQARKAKKGGDTASPRSSVVQAPKKLYSKELLTNVGYCIGGYIIFYLLSSAVASQTKGMGAFDAYGTLGVTSTMSKREMKKVIREMSMKWHPDKNKNHPDRELVKETFMNIQRAAKIVMGEGDPLMGNQ